MDRPLITGWLRPRSVMGLEAHSLPASLPAGASDRPSAREPTRRTTELLPLAALADTIWGAIGVVGGLGCVIMLAWFIGRGHGDRDDEDAARDFYEAHGRWPDEDVT